MNQRGKKLEPKLGLNMQFGEALERFAKTDPDEVEDSIAKGKQKRPSAKRKKRRTKRLRIG